MIKLERPLPPTRPSSFDDAHPFRVWAHQPAYLEDRLPWKCTAAFRFLLEACDYIDSVTARGVAIAFQSPSGVSHKGESA
jgi:hypothetical protein